MKYLPFPGGSYCEALPGGEWAVLMPGTHIETHRGSVLLPEQELRAGGLGVLYLRISQGPKYGFQMCGQSHAGPEKGIRGTWLWRMGVWTLDPRPSYGVGGHIFNADEELEVIEAGPNQTSQGFRYLDDEGHLILGDATLGPMPYELAEWTHHARLVVGQSYIDGAGAICLNEATAERKQIEPGDCRFLRYSRRGMTNAVAMVKPGMAVLRWFEDGELAQFPPEPAVPPPSPPPPIGREMMFGFFVGGPELGGGWTTDANPESCPGNCYLQIPGGKIVAKGGRVIGQYVEGRPDTDLGAINRAIKEAKARVRLPVMAYWPRGAWVQGVPEGAEWIGVEAYRMKGESVGEFHRQVQEAVSRVPRVVLIPQCYTSNEERTKDLASVVPVVVAVARENRNVEGMIVFNGTGRATGLQDHPEVRPLWESVARGVPGLPAPVITPPDPEPKPMPDQPSLDQFTNREFPQVVAARQAYLGEPDWQPDPAWVILIMARRYGFGLAPGEKPWSVRRMVAWDLNPNPGNPAEHQEPPL